MINKVIFIGNLGADPEVRHLESGVSVARLRIATNENYRDKAGEWQTVTEWHDVVAWRWLAERAEKQLTKGSMVYIEGKLTHRKWQDKDGVERYSTEVVANELRSLERRERPETPPLPPFESVASANVTEKSTAAPTSDAGGAQEDDLPF
jgi:single-strand DNA-binding protein